MRLLITLLLIQASISLMAQQRTDTNYYRENNNNEKLINTSVESIESFDSEGKLTGPWIKYYRNGSVCVKGNYKDDRKTGLWQVYESYPNQILEKAYFLNGNLNGQYTSYYTNDNQSVKSIGEYANGKKNNRWNYYSLVYDKSQIDSSGNYKNGLKTGVWTYYNEGKISSAGEFHKNKRMGKWQFYLYDYSDDTEDTLIYFGSYREGLKAGKWTEFYNENINRKAIGKYVNGLKNGLWKFYGLYEALEDSGKYVN